VLFGERGVGLVHFFDRVAGEAEAERAHDTPPHQDVRTLASIRRRTLSWH
jgi:hypothetical protein